MATKRPAKRKVDEFPQRAYANLTTTAADTYSSVQIHFGISMREHVALVIHRIDYNPSLATWNLLVTNADRLQMGIVRSTAAAALSKADPAVIDLQNIGVQTFGTAGTGELQNFNVSADFTGMPGGGIIAPPDPLYLAIDSTSLGATANAHVIIWFSYLEMTREQYWDLVESMQLIT